MDEVEITVLPHEIENPDSSESALTVTPESTSVSRQNPLAGITAADVIPAIRLGIDIASYFTNFGLETAKLSTRFGLRIAHTSVQTISTIIEATAGPNPFTLSLSLAASTISLAEFIAIAGIDISSKAVGVSLGAAKESMAVLDQLFGSDETARALAEFAQLVRREWNHHRDETFLPANMQPFALVPTLTSITAWAALQYVTSYQTFETAQRHIKAIPLSNSLDNFGNGVSGFDEDIETMSVTLREGQIIEGDLENDSNDTNTSGTSTSTIPSPFDRSQDIANLQRLSKFCMGTYGRAYMRFFGMDMPPLPEASQNLNPHHYTFSHVTGVPLENVQSMPNLQQARRGISGPYTPAFYIIRDHSSNSIILSLRGTFSLSDVATDLTCEYVDFEVPSDNGMGPLYKVHEGMLRSAREVRSGEVGRAIRSALEENENYGLCLCGHSLGAGIASILSLLWADPETGLTHAQSSLPVGRQLRSFGFATPCSVDASLSRRASGLITSFTYSSDVVGRLSLGHVLDLRNVVAWLQDPTEGQALAKNIIARAVQYRSIEGDVTAERRRREMGNWFAALRSTLAANMQSDKLYPPGKVLWALKVEEDKVQLFEVLNVEEVFKEMTFARDMLSSHVAMAHELVLAQL